MSIILRRQHSVALCARHRIFKRNRGDRPSIRGWNNARIFQGLRNVHGQWFSKPLHFPGIVQRKSKQPNRGNLGSNIDDHARIVGWWKITAWRNGPACTKSFWQERRCLPESAISNRSCAGGVACQWKNSRAHPSKFFFGNQKGPRMRTRFIPS